MATRKIHFFTGKGGVGKSTLAAAFAQSLATHEKPNSILLTELSENSYFRSAFSAEEQKNLPFALAQWSPDLCLREYALHLLKIESLYKLFFQNPVSKSLIQVAPGLQELAILGKATSGPRRHGPPMLYDQVVIDAMSSGHFMSLFRAPKAMAEIISFGPMGEQSRSIDQWIRNPDFTHVHVVTTSEDYAVTEAIELSQQIRDEFGLKPQILVNKVFNFSSQFSVQLNEPIFDDLLKAQELARSRINESGFSFYEVSFLPELKTASLVQNLSVELRHA